MISFTRPEILWALPIALLPVLIHLINRLRYRRVPWAAMEFLLESHRRYKVRIRLREWFLLLARVTAIALIVLLLAQPLIQAGWAPWLADSSRDHVILLDDSFSMSELAPDQSPFELARQSMVDFLHWVSGRGSPRRVALIRFSKAAQTDGFRPDWTGQTISGESLAQYVEQVSRLAVSYSDAGPLPAVERAVEWVESNDSIQPFIYIFSDFRLKDWENHQPLRSRLAQLQRAGAKIRLIRCAEDEGDNLAIQAVTAGGSLKAAGVPLPVELSVVNYSQQPVEKVAVSIAANETPLPAVLLPRIAAFESAQERSHLWLASAGEYRFVVQLPPDRLAADNVRYVVLRVAEAVRVLLVEDMPGTPNARYIEAALRPTRTVETGIRVRLRTSRELAPALLEESEVVFLLDVERLEPSAVQALKDYVGVGGGLVYFVGEQVNAPFYTETLYENSRGLFPAPLGTPRDLPPDFLSNLPDVQVGDHPIFRVFQGARNSFLAMVNVDRYFTVAEGWSPEESGAQVLARLRNGAPWVIYRPWGEGVVVAFLTTAAPVWNNWARGNPSFVITLLELVSAVARKSREIPELIVGQPFVWRLERDRYRPQLRYRLPDQGGTVAGALEATAGDGGALEVKVPPPMEPGFGTLELTDIQGETQEHLFAVNVNPQEGDLRLIGTRELSEKLAGLDCEILSARAIRTLEEPEGSADLVGPFLMALLVLLMAEQSLAYWASYHSRQKTAHRYSRQEAKHVEKPTAALPLGSAPRV